MVINNYLIVITCANLKFDKKVKDNEASRSSYSLALPYTAIVYTNCFPGGNFESNQLPDCSMGLSPLYSTLTSDLHVNIVTRTSMRISPHFVQFKYRSQSFGSQSLCFNSTKKSRIIKDWL